MKKILLSVFLFGSLTLSGQTGYNGYNNTTQGNQSWTGGGMTVHGGVYSAPPRPQSGCMMPLGMNEMQFRDLKCAISRQAFDNTRLSIAEQAISANSVSSAQVRDLARLLTFECNRLTLAKFAYRFCADPQQYFLVNDAFTFTSSVEELNRELGLDHCSTGNMGNNGYYGNGYGGGGHGSGHGNGNGHGSGQGGGNGQGHGWGTNSGNTGGGCGMMPVSSNEFCQIKTSISNQWFDSSRLTLAKQIASSKLLTSSQVAEIMGLFSFESTKLDFAKFAYRGVFDPQNYFVVNNAFTFNSSVDELSKFIYGF